MANPSDSALMKTQHSLWLGVNQAGA